MNSWIAKIQQLANDAPLAAFSIATTGLTEDDEVIALAYSTEILHDHSDIKTVYRLCDSSKLESTAQYHRISLQMLLDHGSTDDAIISNILNEPVVWFTYNKDFQLTYLQKYINKEVFIIDLPKLIRLADSRMQEIESIDTLKQMIDIIDRSPVPPPFRRMLSSFAFDNTPLPGQLPVQRNVEGLCHMVRDL